MYMYRLLVDVLHTSISNQVTREFIHIVNPQYSLYEMNKAMYNYKEVKYLNKIMHLHLIIALLL
jgi:hypothetical protein